MARNALIFGFLLILLGAGGYLSAHAASPTALIPAAFGLLLVLAGLIGKRSQATNKHAMHVAALVSLLGAVSGLFMGIPNGLKWAGGHHELWLKAVSQLGLGLLSLAFLLLCIRSFKRARAERAS